MDTIKVMVYGTLKCDHYNHHYMQKAQGKFIDTCVSKDNNYQLCSVNGSFPGLISGKGYFKGELFEVPTSNIGILDQLEGYPYMYDRGFIHIVLDSTKETELALVYFLQQDFINRNSGFLSNYAPELSVEDNCYSWS